MMTSSYRNIIRVTGHLCVEFTVVLRVPNPYGVMTYKLLTHHRHCLREIHLQGKMGDTHVKYECDIQTKSRVGMILKNRDYNGAEN